MGTTIFGRPRRRSLGLECTSADGEGVACFDIKTGDVEDAPALDPIAKFEIIEKDGGVYIKGEEEVIKASRGHLNTKCQAKGDEKVLVIGRYVTPLFGSLYRHF